jgi:Ca-activated chloride channel family protein
MSQHLDGLNLVELLGQLEPVPEPVRVAMTPQTPGWIVLGLAVLGLVLWAAVILLRRHRSNAYRRAAMAELNVLSRTGNNPAEIAVLLRRTALAAYPRHQVASLHGDTWLRFLDAHFPGDGFCRGPGRDLAAAPWRPVEADPALTALARVWILTHQPIGKGQC